MGHARADELRDIDDVVVAIRALTGIVERSPGIFYIRRSPFLHFHTKDGRRWADIKSRTEWGCEVPLPFECSPGAKTAFLREVRARHRATVGARLRPSRRRMATK